jgi:hypothetical protein
MTDLRPEGAEPCENVKSGAEPGRQAIRFLLMDPEKAMIQAKQGDEQVLVYPNPAGSTFNVQVTNATAQKVKIELLNNDGKVIRVLSESELPAGKQVRQFSIEDLPSKDIYFVKTTVASKTITVKLMKK